MTAEHRTTEYNSSPIKDTVGAYLATLNQMPSLSHEQTKMLFGMGIHTPVKAVANKLLGTAKSDKEKEKWAAALHGAVSVRDVLWVCHGKLVVKPASNAHAQYPSFDLDELIQFGNIGLLSAINNFDVTRNYMLSTYAVPWIVQTIQRGIYNTRGKIRVPIHMYESLNRVNRQLDAQPELTSAQREALLRQQGLSEDTTEFILHSKHPARWSVLSLDEAYTNEDGEEVPRSSAIPDRSGTSPEQPIEQMEAGQDRKRAIQLLLRSGLLTSREIDMMLQRSEGEKLEAIAEQYGLTRERVRQIILNVQRRIIKNPFIHKGLYELFENNPQFDIAAFSAALRSSKRKS